MNTIFSTNLFQFSQKQQHASLSHRHLTLHHTFLSFVFLSCVLPSYYCPASRAIIRVVLLKWLSRPCFHTPRCVCVCVALLPTAHRTKTHVAVRVLLQTAKLQCRRHRRRRERTQSSHVKQHNDRQHASVFYFTSPRRVSVCVFLRARAHSRIYITRFWGGWSGGSLRGPTSRRLHTRADLLIFCCCLSSILPPLPLSRAKLPVHMRSIAMCDLAEKMDGAVRVKWTYKYICYSGRWCVVSFTSCTDASLDKWTVGHINQIGECMLRTFRSRHPPPPPLKSPHNPLANIAYINIIFSIIWNPPVTLCKCAWILPLES